MTSSLDAPPELEVARARFVPRVDALTAARRHWPLVVLVTVVFTGIGVGTALRRQPVYTAESRLAAGRLDSTNAGAAGAFATSTQALAEQYSRSIDTPGVTRSVAARVGLTPAQVAARVSATPIPESPVVRVFAQGSDGTEAVRIANAAATGLIAYTTKQNRLNPDTGRLLRLFRQASTDVQRVEARVATRRRANDAASTSTTRRRLRDAQVTLDVAQLRRETARAAYDASTRGQASTVLLSPLQPATAASNDRSRYLQLFGFIGFVAGLTIGLALATLRANRVLRRRLGF
jgi:capsular polysaccharide biosynthesis protein